MGAKVDWKGGVGTECLASVHETPLIFSFWWDQGQLPICEITAFLF